MSKNKPTRRTTPSPHPLALQVVPSQPLILIATSETLPAELPPALSDFFRQRTSHSIPEEESADDTVEVSNGCVGSGGQCIVEVGKGEGVDFSQAVKRAAEEAATTISSKGHSPLLNLEWGPILHDILQEHVR